MTPWPPNIQKQWFAVAQSGNVRNKPLAVSTLGTHVVLARLDGAIVAFEDRCPHRHVPLSGGRITQDGIECPYHGWTFGRDGLCTKLPGSTCTTTYAPRVPSYAVFERDGIAWLNLDPQANVNGLPTLVKNTNPNQRRFLWQTLWKAPILDCLENFLDAMHTHYVHAGLVRRASQRRSVITTLKKNPEGFSVEYGGAPMQSGLLYRLFESPRISERALFAAPGVAQIEYCYANGSEVRITLYFAPRDEQSTHVLTTLHVSGRWAPAWAVKWFVWPFLHKVATQDARVLQHQTTNRTRFPSRRYATCANDLVRPYLERVWTDIETESDLPETKQIELLI